MKKFSTYKETFDFLMSIGVKVDFSFSTECYGKEKEEGDEYLKCWMVRTLSEDGKHYEFACGLDLIGDGQLWASGDTFPCDENVFNNIARVVERIYHYRFVDKHLRPEEVKIQVDRDVYYPM